MKVAGVLLCVSAIASAAVGLATARSAGSAGPAQAVPLGSSFLVLVFGAALYQGVGAVRAFVLGCAALGCLGALAGLAFLGSLRELRLLFAAVLVTGSGYLALLFEKQASRARVIVGVLLVLAGSAGSAGAQLWLTGFERRAFATELRPLLAPERQYEDTASGLSFRPPAGWSLLEEDAQLFAAVPAKVRLADPDAGAVAFINDEPQPPGLLSLDNYLDSVLAAQRQAGLESRQHDRRDAAVGKALARRMSISWTHDGRPYSGFVSAWLDGPRVYTLFGAAVGAWNESTEERFRALEGSLRFSAPVETALSDAQARLTRECPVFTDEAVRMIARRIPPTSPTEAYFRTGWRWAIQGQGQIDAARAAELRQLMADVFSRMSSADRATFGAYSEQLRGGAATTPAEDGAAMRILGRAASALPPDSLGRLRGLVDTSLTVGGLL
jgi:hypothetical protein